MFHFSILVALWIVWFVKPLRSAWPILIAWTVAATPMIPILMRYQDVHSWLHLSRDINEIKRFGVDLVDFIAAPPQLTVWGGRLGASRPETAVFPGVTVIALAATAAFATGRRLAPPLRLRGWRLTIGLVATGAVSIGASVFVLGPWRLGTLSVGNAYKPLSIACAAALILLVSSKAVQQAWRRQSVAAFYALAVLAMYLLALGPEPRLLGAPILYEPPYAWLMRLPGFATLRVPARFVMTAAVCQAVLVGCAVSAWAVGPRKRALVAILGAGLFVDGWFSLRMVMPPAKGVLDWTQLPVRAVLELPMGDLETDFGALFRSLTHGVPIVNGVSGYAPPQLRTADTGAQEW